jgi:hypothetical protein
MVVHRTRDGCGAMNDEWNLSVNSPWRRASPPAHAALPCATEKARKYYKLFILTVLGVVSR